MDVLKKFWGINKCYNDFTINDFVKHDAFAKNMLSKRFKGRLFDIGYSLGTDLEDKKGEILGPTNSLVIVEQMKRTICGDRFWFSNSPFLREGMKFDRSH